MTMSKIFQASYRICRMRDGIVVSLLVPRVRILPQFVPARRSGDYIPPSQYDIPFPEKMRFGTLMRKNWEIIPLFSVTAIAILLVFFAIGWSCKNKVDVVWETHTRDNISRTMNLLFPQCHKVITINQQYEPWPEMYNVQREMKAAHKRWLTRQNACKTP